MDPDAPTCPYCHKILPVRAVIGSVIVYCRNCKREITVVDGQAR